MTTHRNWCTKGKVNNQQNFITPTKTTTLIITGEQRIRLITNKILLHQEKQQHTS